VPDTPDGAPSAGQSGAAAAPWIDLGAPEVLVSQPAAVEEAVEQPDELARQSGRRPLPQPALAF